MQPTFTRIKRNNMQINKVMLYGNLTRDPEIKALPNGTSVANFSIATNRKWKDKDGNQQEEVEFHNIVVFGNQANAIGQYMRKGSAMFVEGRLRTRTWEKDGVKRYATEIVAESTQFGPKSATTGNNVDQTTNDTNDGVDADTGDSVNPEDIPF